MSCSVIHCHYVPVNLQSTAKEINELTEMVLTFYTDPNANLYKAI